MGPILARVNCPTQNHSRGDREGEIQDSDKTIAYALSGTVFDGERDFDLRRSAREEAALLSGKKFDSRLDYVTRFAKDLKRPVSCDAAFSAQSRLS